MNINLDEIILRSGGHDTRTQGVCLLEAVAWFAGENHTDHPKCVSPVVAAYGRRINDTLPEEKRQSLKSLIPVMIVTGGDGFDSARGYLAIDWILRVYVPTWLDLAGMTSQASELRELKQIVDCSTLLAAKPSIDAAGAAAGAAAGDAAWDAARDAARSAAWAAAWDAAWDAAGAAARDAARAAAGDAALAAAWAAARAAAMAAARAAARDALRPTVGVLQDSAIDLFHRMITIGDRDGG